MLVFVVSYLILLLSHKTCLFSNEIQKEDGSIWERSWAGAGRTRGRGKCHQDILYEGEIYFQ